MEAWRNILVIIEYLHFCYLDQFCHHLVILHVNMMLLGGFGFLMTFLKRFGFSALGMTMLIVVVATEWSILLWGFTKLDATFSIHLTMMEFAF